MLYFKIKLIYPQINDSEFLLQNDSDGKGEYIKDWTSKDYLKPTQERLNSVSDIEANILRNQTLAKKQLEASIHQNLVEIISNLQTRLTALEIVK